VPQQVPRLLAVFSLVVGGLLVMRGRLIPETFGDVGHYRAAAVDSIAARPIKYAGHSACADCHDVVAEKRLSGNHRGVTCETCHGPAAAHVDGPMDVKPTVPDTRQFCVTCHAYDRSRPTGFPQIDPAAHNYPQACRDCHDPHAPVPPVVPQECSACHARISHQKAVSHHTRLACTTCHEADERHKANPRAVRPTKPTSRAVCGNCHASAAKRAEQIPQIDLQSHGGPALCWQCHYPHYPEVR